MSRRGVKPAITDKLLDLTERWAISQEDPHVARLALTMAGHELPGRDDEDMERRRQLVRARHRARFGAQA